MRNFFKDFKTYTKENKIRYGFYFTVRFFILVVMVLSIISRNWSNVFMCVVSLALIMIPSIVDRRFNIALPQGLEAIIVLFVFAAQILGEIGEYYLRYALWDDMLHTTNGFIMAAIGFSLIAILNNNDKIQFTLTPFFVAFFAFCFSMTTAVIWEFFEYSMDAIFLTDMQKDTIIPQISSVLFNPEGKNSAVTLPIETIVINGEQWAYGGYIDIGLIDTMLDMFVNFIGAVAFSIIGFFYQRRHGHGKIASMFMPKLKKETK